LFFTIMSGLFTRTSLSVCISWFHSTVTSSCWHTGLGMWEYQFSVVSMSLFFYILSNVDVYRLYHVLLCTHSLPEWDILMLGGQ
jgi:hypothetical protein